MHPNNNMPVGMMPAVVKKRRSRKKKPVASDPEAERQEMELRMKIKQSLHTQQVLRTEVEEEDKAQQRSLNVNNVVNADVGGGMVGGVPAGLAGMGTNPMNNVLMSQMAMGYGGMQPQMGGMTMQQQQQQQQQFQYNNQGQQYGYPIQGGSGAMEAANVSNMQQQMQQMKLQLEMQQKQLEEQLRLKQQLQMQQAQQAAYAQNGGRQTPDMGGNVVNGMAMNAQPQSSAPNTPSPQYMPAAHFQQGSGYQSGSTQPSPLPSPGNAQQQLQHRYSDGSAPQDFIANQLSHAPSNQQLQHRYSDGSAPSDAAIQSSPGASNQQLQHRYSDGSDPSCATIQQDQQSKNDQALLYNVQNQATQQQQYQSPSYPSPQQGPVNPPDQQSKGQYGQLTGRPNQQKRVTNRASGLKSSQETTDKSLFSLSSNADSWLKTGSANSSLNNSMAFHSVGGMSASFGSAMEGAAGGLDSSRSSESSKVPNDVVVGNGSGGTTNMRGSGGNSIEPKKISDERISKGPTYTETTVGLHPIQENEAADSSNNADKFGQSSIMMSCLDDQWAQSHLTEGPSNSMSYNEMKLSLDSTTFDAMMKQSQLGDMNLSTLMASETAANQKEPTQQKQSSSSSEDNSLGTGAQGDKLSDYNSSGNGQAKSSAAGIRLKTKDSTSSDVSEEHRLSKESKESSFSHSRAGTRGSNDRRGSTFSKMSMMSEISQWTKNNPFDTGSLMSTSESPAGGDGGVNKKKQQRQQIYGDMNMRDHCPVDMGDFHSVGGSIANSLDISMMSSMTGDPLNIGDGLNESLRALDLSNKSGDKNGGQA